MKSLFAVGLGCVLLSGLSGASTSAPQEGAADQTPQWIWSAQHGLDGAPESRSAWMRAEFELAQPGKNVELFGTCDNSCEVFVDGKLVAKSAKWERPFRIELDDLSPGVHRVAVAATNTGGPAGLVLSIRADSGKRTLLSTGEGWHVRVTEPEDGWQNEPLDDYVWLPAVTLGPLGMQPWGKLAEPKKEVPLLAGSELELPPGFEAELLYPVPLATQGSWVCLTFDSKGRLITSDQRGALWRVNLAGDGSVAGVEKLDIGLGRAQGLLDAFGSLYIMVAEGKGAGLYRATDTTGDDVYDRVEFILELSTGGEHGPHAVIVHPDGESLAIIAGNHVPLPEGFGKLRPTSHWGEDQLLPRVPDPRGHAGGIKAPGGWVARISPDGEERELIAIGMRNAYDIAIGPDEELFTFDSDMEWDVGLPWYKPTRVLHLASGAEFGWRHGSGKWPAHWEDSSPGVLDLGLASPTGVIFGDQGNFPGRWGNAFFVADWAYGTLHAVHLESSGGSYKGTSEIFAQGKPFPITDLVFGPDGNMYVTTGGRGAQSGLYRIRAVEGERIAGFFWGADAATVLRKTFEALHGEPDLNGEFDLAALIDGLAHEDRHVRFAARTALEQRRPLDWVDTVLGDPRARVVASGCMAAARVPGGMSSERLLERLEWCASQDLGAADQRLWARSAQLVMTRLGDPTGDQHTRWTGLVEARMGTADPALELDLFALLVRLDSPLAPELGLARMGAATTQEGGLAYAFALRSQSAGWTLANRDAYLSWLDDPARAFQGGASLRAYVDGLIKDHLAGADEGQRSNLEAARAARAQAPPAARKPTVFVKAYTRVDVTALLREGDGEADPKLGEEAFRKSLCIDCHRVNGEGGATGPDLTATGSRYSVGDLLTAILEPSSTISDQYQELEVWTEDGQVFVGRKMAEEDGWLTLQPSAEGADPVEVEVAEIKLRRPHPLSRMPAGLLDVLSPEEIRALFAYTLGDK